jgi:hypothetical protein
MAEELNLQVGASTDDVRRYLVGDGWELSSAEFGAGYISGSIYKLGCGARFTGVTIPKGATINTAYLTLRARANRTSTTVNTRISAEKADNPDTFADDKAAFDSRFANHTDARIDWDNIPAWTAGTDYNSPEIKTVIQEIVNRAGWASGNALVIFWEDFDARSTYNRVARSYDDDPTYAPKLHIEYTAGGQTYEASATMSGEGGLAAKAVYTAIAKATLSGAGTLAAKGSYLRTATATLSGTGTLAAAAQRTRAVTATMSGEGSLSAAATLITAALTGSATMSGTGSLAAAAYVTRTVTATMAGAGTLSAAARLTLAATGILSGQGALSASATFLVFATAQLSGTGALSASGVRIAIASATLAGVGCLTAAAQTFGLMASLYAAQKKAVRSPYVEAKVYDYERGIKRLTWTRLYTGEEPDNHHGIAFDGEGSMHRIRAGSGSKLYYQKITSPGESSDFSSWSEVAADCSGPCAIAASGGKIYIFYRKTDDTLRKYYSHDYGQNWTNAELVAYSGALSMAACWWGTGSTVVCFALRSDQLNAITLNTGTQAATQHAWSDGNHPLLNTYGIGCTYNASLGQCEVVFAGKESDSPYNHYDLFRTVLSDTYNFLALESFLMAPEGEDITYEYPDCHLPPNPQAYETNRVLAVEKFAGTTAYTRPIICHQVKGTYWSDTTFN